MLEIESKTKKWGSSLAFIIPKEIAREKNLKPNQRIKVILEEDDNVLEKSFGLLRDKIKKPTQEIMDEIDKELWGE